MDGATLTCAPQAKAFPSTLGASVSVYCSSCIGFALCGFLLFSSGFLPDSSSGLWQSREMSRKT